MVQRLPMSIDLSVFPCRSCGQTRLTPVLSLGDTPLANALLTQAQLAEPEGTYPLDLVFCPDCCLVQITETVPPETLFGNYFYFSSFSDTMLRHAETLVGQLVERRHLGPDSLCVEIASNDGYLLQYYHQRDIPVLGIEPAANIAKVAQEERGIRTRCEFFTRELAETLVAEGLHADVIHANNVMAHVADLNGFMAGIGQLLKHAGLAVIEAPYVRDMIEHVEFDTIYHEHLCYFSLTAVDHLVRRHGLQLVDVERLAIHGGSLRFVIGKADAVTDGRHQVSPAVAQLLAEEAQLGLTHLPYYRNFAKHVEQLRTGLLDVLRELKAEGRSIAAYGASAKGSTLLNYFGIGAETLDFVVDRSTVKQGHYTPGTHLLIESPDQLMAVRPDYVLLLTWNFAEEIMAQQAAYREQGGRFIMPLSQPHVV
ncbi:MAG: class I SAM-dependent methyltransferase [Candidatus Sericytochromatia bacterium]|nr:class I SAM-dependent methyltransferase [Candidatus Sericytochromatia bacterium]